MSVSTEHMQKLWLECANPPKPPQDYILVSDTVWNIHIQYRRRGYVVRRCFRRNGRKIINWGHMR